MALKIDPKWCEHMTYQVNHYIFLQTHFYDELFRVYTKISPLLV